MEKNESIKVHGNTILISKIKKFCIGGSHEILEIEDKIHGLKYNVNRIDLMYSLGGENKAGFIFRHARATTYKAIDALKIKMLEQKSYNY